jgi:hypothetical protein
VSLPLTGIKAIELDVKRELYLGRDAALQFFEKKAGQAGLGAPLFAVTSGWNATKERNRGEVATLFVIEIVEQEGVEADKVARSNRVNVAGTLCVVERFSPPVEQPRMWTVYAREEKVGDIKR